MGPAIAADAQARIPNSLQGRSRITIYSFCSYKACEVRTQNFSLSNTCGLATHLRLEPFKKPAHCRIEIRRIVEIGGVARILNNGLLSAPYL